jgi:DNA-binding transcriptional MerR regulator
MDKPIPNKLFFKIGEVCEITDTQPYVLRYWESEFQALAPAKNSSGQRIYRRKDIETVLRIKQLLYDEGFTIAGAKKRLEAEASGKGPTPNSMAAETAPVAEPAPAVLPVRPDAVAAPQAPRPPEPAKEEVDLRDVLLQVRDQLREMLTLMDKGDRNV